MTDTPTPRRRFRARAILVVALVVVALVAVALPVWTSRAADAITQVEVVPGPGDPQCGEQEAPWVVDAEMPRITSTVTAVPGGTCLVTFSVVNHGSSAVKVDGYSVEGLLNPTWGRGVLVVGTTGIADVPTQDSMDREDDQLFYDVDSTVEPDESATFTYALDVNPRACSSPGIWGVPGPTVQLSAFGRSSSLLSPFSTRAEVTAGVGPNTASCSAE